MNDSTKRTLNPVYVLSAILIAFSLIITSPPQFSHAAKTKSLEILIKNRTGQKVGFYTGSYALLIGVSDYTAGWPDLESVPEELERVAAALKKQGFQVQKVLNPSSDRMTAAFDGFIDKYGFDQNNRLLFFYSGHGHTRKKGKKGYLVPSDTPDPRYDERGFYRKALGMGQVLTWARRIEAKHVLFAFDSCFSGTVFKTKALPKIPPHISDITSKPVRQFISAGSAGEEIPAQSVFVPSFVRGLRGEADLDKDGYITGTELGMYLHRKVLYYNPDQTPQYGKIRDPDLDEGDFVFQLASSSAVVDKPSTASKKTMLSVEANVIGAKVYMDGKYMGQTPLEERSVVPGEHRLVVEKDGYDPYQKRIEVEPGRSKSFYVDLNRAGPRKGRLFVDTEPADARVRVLNIQERFHQGMELDADRYHVEVSAKGYETKKMWVSLDAGEDKSLDIRLTPIPKITAEKEKTFTVGGVSFKMIRIPAGNFTMESPSTESRRSSDEGPQQRVTLTKDFSMGETEVTQGLWQAVMGSNPSSFKNCGKNCPVERVSWNDAQEFIKKLNRLIPSGNFRLPTEAEWEYAARAGSTTRFNFVDDEGRLGQYAWYSSNSNRRTHSVAQKKPNAWGLYDMHGNVWEWVQDWYGNYPSGAVNDPSGPSKGADRVIRGGSWHNDPDTVRCALRYPVTPPENSKNVLGFRLARTH